MKGLNRVNAINLMCSIWEVSNRFNVIDLMCSIKKVFSRFRKSPVRHENMALDLERFDV